MAAEGGVVVSHQVIENSTEKGRYIVKLQEQGTGKNNCFPEIFNENFTQGLPWWS